MEAFEHKNGASNARHEVYVIENYDDFKMVNNYSMVDQSHGIQVIVGEL